MSEVFDRQGPEIDLSANVTAFFRDMVDVARRKSGIEATEAAQTYVVALLADYAKPDHRTGETLCRPLTLLLSEALQQAGHERFERLRILGDGVLYVSGFFGDHLQNRGVELDYVSSVGARAYGGAASMLRKSGTFSGSSEAAAPDVFSELSERFQAFVELLSYIADTVLASSAHGSNRAVLKAYERWLRTGSASLAEALASRGLVPLRGDGTLH